MSENISFWNNFETKVFNESNDFRVFQEILDTLDHIFPIFVSRDEYNARKWNIIKQIWSDKFWEQYNLFLPKDLKISELPSIIYRVNNLTFWENIPEYSSTNEIKIKIILAIDFLLNELKWIWVDQKETQNSIKKYIRLYAQMFWEQEAGKLNIREFRKEIINSVDREKYYDYEKKLLLIKSRESLSVIKDELENIVSDEIWIQFEESFFERWVNMLRIWMETITQADQMAIKDKQKEWDTILFHADIDELDEKEKLLRDKIGIDQLKVELKQLRELWDQEIIAKKELEITNKILKVLYEYPYQLILYESWEKWYQPDEILRLKEIYCVWFSLLWHAFLSELWIKHNWLDLPGHSALEVIIWSKSYLFDATFIFKVLEFSYWDKVWAYKQIEFIDFNTEYKALSISWDSEKILFAQIYNNKWIYLNKIWRHTEAIKMHEKAIKLHPNYYSAYKNIGNSLSSLWIKNESIDILNKAIKMYNKALELNPNDSNIYYAVWNILYITSKIEDAIKIYNKALELDPNYDAVYKNKGISFKKIWKTKLWKLNIYISELLTNNNSYFEILYRNEKSKIRDYINRKDFEWLRLYMLSIEKGN